MDAQQEWYFVDNQGQQAGPLSRDELKGRLSSGRISPTTLVWTNGMSDWVAASTVDGLTAPAAPAAAQDPQPQASPAELNPYSSPQADLGPAYASAETKPGFWNMLFSFQGRIPRRAYWGYTFLIVGIYYAIVFAVIAVFGEQSNIALAVMFILYIPLIWSTIAIQVKRWHDRDKSGWMYLVNFIPFVGGIWAFIECGCLRGTFGINSYGEDPT